MSLTHQLSGRNSAFAVDIDHSVLNFDYAAESAAIMRGMASMHAIEDLTTSFFASREGVTAKKAELFRISVESVIVAGGLATPAAMFAPSFESSTVSDYSAEAEEKSGGLLSRIWEWIKNAWKSLKERIKKLFGINQRFFAQYAMSMDQLVDQAKILVASKTRGEPRAINGHFPGIVTMGTLPAYIGLDALGKRFIKGIGDSVALASKIGHLDAKNHTFNNAGEVLKAADGHDTVVLWEDDQWGKIVVDAKGARFEATELGRSGTLKDVAAPAPEKILELAEGIRKFGKEVTHQMVTVERGIHEMDAVVAHMEKIFEDAKAAADAHRKDNLAKAAEHGHGVELAPGRSHQDNGAGHEIARLANAVHAGEVGKFRSYQYIVAAYGNVQTGGAILSNKEREFFMAGMHLVRACLEAYPVTHEEHLTHKLLHAHQAIQKVKAREAEFAAEKEKKEAGE